MTSYSCFQAKFLDIIGTFVYSHAPYFCKKSSAIHSPYSKVFVKYRAQGGEVNPNPLLAYALVHALQLIARIAKKTYAGMLPFMF